ncbi:hypothetical protein [Devosia submarina]|uniref:hypothetical protein n=1 Tax=Devosia submarina TaxID=1173082 RepID=UPI000D37BF45|nr:hypothetical protein [Devosia submarina]
MIRPLLALALLASPTIALAQQAVPAPSEVVVDPAAPIDATPKQANLLTGMYATKAVIEICAISFEEGVINGMNADQKRLETSLLMDAPTAEKAYAQVKADVEKTSPDCTEGSPDRLGVQAVADIYRSTAPAAGQTEAPAPAAPAQ